MIVAAVDGGCGVMVVGGTATTADPWVAGTRAVELRPRVPDATSRADDDGVRVRVVDLPVGVVTGGEHRHGAVGPRPLDAGTERLAPLPAEDQEVGGRRAAGIEAEREVHDPGALRHGPLDARVDVGDGR